MPHVGKGRRHRFLRIKIKVRPRSYRSYQSYPPIAILPWSFQMELSISDQCDQAGYSTSLCHCQHSSFPGWVRICDATILPNRAVDIEFHYWTRLFWWEKQFHWKKKSYIYPLCFQFIQFNDKQYIHSRLTIEDT